MSDFSYQIFFSLRFLSSFSLFLFLSFISLSFLSSSSFSHSLFPNFLLLPYFVSLSPLSSLSWSLLLLSSSAPPLLLRAKLTNNLLQRLLLLLSCRLRCSLLHHCVHDESQGPTRIPTPSPMTMTRNPGGGPEADRQVGRPPKTRFGTSERQQRSRCSPATSTSAPEDKRSKKDVAAPSEATVMWVVATVD